MLVRADENARDYVGKANAFLTGTDSPRGFLEECIAEIERREDDVRAFVVVDFEAARAAADRSVARYRDGKALSPIDGMPIGVKDIIDTCDLPTQMNSPLFDGFRPRSDAACVVALRQAGAIILGKTATAEFACATSAPTRNPHNFHCTPGGSSSGSAAAVGAGFAPAALGTQTQASTIRPASYCGTYGYKPTHRSLSLVGVAPLSTTLDHLGFFAQSLPDIWAVAGVVARAGGGHGARGLNTGSASNEVRPPNVVAVLQTPAWNEAQDDDHTGFEGAVECLSKSGFRIIDRLSDPRVDYIERLLQSVHAASLDIMAYEACWPLKSYQDRDALRVGTTVTELIARADAMSEADYFAALRVRDDLRNAIETLRGEVDCFVALASSGPAPKGLAFSGSRAAAVPWTMYGGPAFSLPLLQSRGLPLGLQVMGFLSEDAVLYGHAQAAVAAIRRREAK